MSRPPRIPNWLPWEASTIYFITLCVEDRKAVLANPRAWRICLETFDTLNQWRILSAVAMPDHLHIIAAPSDREASLSDFVKWFKRWFNEAYFSSRKPISWHWQEGCFDRLLRSEDSLSEKWEYVRQNPVRAGLVSNPDDWPYQFQFNDDEL